MIFGFISRAFRKKIVEPIKYGNKEDYNVEKYWHDRFLKYDLNIKGASNDGISEEENYRMYKWAETIFINILRNKNLNPKTLKVLEIGLGNGFYTNIMNQLKVKNYTAIDITNILFSKLESKFPKYSFIKKDVTQEKLEGSYDLIIMMDVIQHIVNDSKLEFAFNNIKSCLSDKGIFILTPINKKTQKHLFYIKWRSLENIKKNFEDYNISEPIKFKGELLITIQKSSLKSVH
ncbi:class I SAM-dependent methyltransferase [Candidatus Woesearchaeota archaeon]|nr:class I SAM-dependent methyltransferase [Candidatus Woesearchaeota archaeon]